MGENRKKINGGGGGGGEGGEGGGSTKLLISQMPFLINFKSWYPIKA